MPDGSQSVRSEINLVVVEDDPDACEALVELLELEGFHTVGLRDAKSALAVLSNLKNAILISDVALRDKDGISLGQEATAKFPECRVILVSGYAPGSRTYPPNWEWLQKPIDLEQLVERILKVAKTPVTRRTT